MNYKKIITSTLLLSSLALTVTSGLPAFAQEGSDQNNQNDFTSFKEEFFARYPELRSRYERLRNQRERQEARRNNRPVRIRLGNTNLEQLQEGHYEGWVISGEEKISFGKFNFNDRGRYVDVNGNRISPNRFEVPGGTQVDKLVITIEPEGDTDDIPSGIVIAESSSDKTDGRLTFQALDLTNVDGTYVLTTPSDDPEGNDTSGVWFIEPGNPLQPSLDLVSLDGVNWVYEGWAVFDGNPLTTGRFNNADAPDQFAGFNASENVPPFPGEDFLQNLPNDLEAPIDLANGSSKIVITLEPDIDGVDPTGDSPSQIKFLVDDVPENATPGQSIDLDLNIGDLPFIDAQIR